MTPEEKIIWVKQNHGNHLDRASKEFDRIVKSRRNLDQKALGLLAEVDKVMALFGDVSPCKKGCSYCCNQSLIIFEWEANRITDVTGRKQNPFKGVDFERWSPQTRKQYIAQYTEVPCPFLKNDVCSIYAARPMSCRVHLSLADDATACDILGNPGASVPYANMEFARHIWAVMFLNAGQRAGDIREFFGD